MTDYLEDELEMLTPQEREALESEQEETTADTPEAEEAVDELADVTAQQTDETHAQPENEDEPVKEASEEEPAQPQAVTPPVFPSFDAPEDAQERLSKIDEDLEKIGSEFEGGGLTAMEYQRQMLRLMNEKIELREQIFKASLSEDIQSKTWADVTVPAFLDAHPQYRDNQVLFDSLDLQVRKLQGENPQLARDPSILVKAHERLKSVFNVGAAGQPPVEVTNALAKSQSQREMPPNLGVLPAADMTPTADGGLFRYLDKLADENIEKYEEELAKLPDEQLEAYLKFA